ncbi:hypothetical protein JCM3774_001620 [Rhodotorula dairenensis]
MAHKDDNKPDASSTLVALALHVPNKPTPLPVASHLRGLDNYDVWTIQLRALVGVNACKVIDGKPHEVGPSTLHSGTASTTLSSYGSKLL